MSLIETVSGFTLPGDRKASIILTIGSWTGVSAVNEIQFFCKSRKHS